MRSKNRSMYMDLERGPIYWNSRGVIVGAALNPYPNEFEFLDNYTDMSHLNNQFPNTSF